MPGRSASSRLLPAPLRFISRVNIVPDISRLVSRRWCSFGNTSSMVSVKVFHVKYQFRTSGGHEAPKGKGSDHVLLVEDDGVAVAAPFRGVALAALSAFFISVCSLLVKTSRLPPGQISFYGFLVTLLFSLPLAVYRGEVLFPEGKRALLVGHSLACSPLILASYQAVRLMPLADEAVLSYSSIVFTIVLARLVLREPCGPADILASVLILVGVVLLARPFLDDSPYPNYIWGALLSLSASFFDSLSYILVRKLTDLHFSVILVNYSVTCLLLSSCFAAFEEWVFLPSSMTPCVLTVAVFTAVQEFLVTSALLIEEAGLVALAQTSDIVFAYLWEIAFFDETYSTLRILGAGLIITVLVVSALYKHRTIK